MKVPLVAAGRASRPGARCPTLVLACALAGAAATPAQGGGPREGPAVERDAITLNVKADGYVHRGLRPHDVDAFELVPATRLENGKRVPITNFSYVQPWHVPGSGFVCFFTRYNYPAKRTICFMTSPDGVERSEWTRLAAIDEGHARKPSESTLCFCDRQGNVRRLPREMEGEFAEPERVVPAR